VIGQPLDKPGAVCFVPPQLKGDFMKILLLSVSALSLATLTVPAHAGCELSSSTRCSTGSGGTYRTEKNLGGGYNTERNGNPYGSTSQNLNGSWTERNANNETRIYNSNPYGGSSNNNSTYNNNSNNNGYNNSYGGSSNGGYKPRW
jgi:hypothetical protein